MEEDCDDLLVPRPWEAVAFDPIEFRLALEVAREATKSSNWICPDNGGPGAERLRFSIATNQRFGKNRLKLWSFRYRCMALDAIWNRRGFIKRFPDRSERTWAAAAELASSFPVGKRFGFESKSFYSTLSKKLKDTD